MEEIASQESLVGMKRKLFFTALGVVVLVFALAGWTVQGIRWAWTARAAA